ncbi:ABC transporter ATP-binding protein [Egibacter rhizosphaerae]|nr:ATP-binding cassette domain-containing protein [Egibacter rhizosphaerae]
MSILDVEGVSKRFGGLWALHDVHVRVEPGTVVGLIGPNGSGKTTLLNVCNGVYAPSEGEVRLDGTPIRSGRPHRVAAAGVMRTFQDSRVFRTLTAMQNMRVPLLHSRVSEGEVRRRAWELLEFVHLTDHGNTAASELSGGQRKLLEFARALMPRPRLILMDEPLAGVHPEIKQLLTERIRAACDDGVSVVVVSHELPALLGVTDHVACLVEGRVLLTGEPAEVTGDSRVVEAYLGTELGEELSGGGVAGSEEGVS